MMRNFNFSSTKCLILILLLLVATGCRGCAGKIEPKIWGTAIVNGNEYEYKSSRGWWGKFVNRSCIYSLPLYQQFEFRILLSSKGSKITDFEYEICFYVSQEKELRADYAYKIEYNSDLESFKGRYLVSGISGITPNGGDGVALIFTEDCKIPKSLKGEFVIQQIDSQTMHCSGYYSLNTPDSISDNPFVIKGSFEADILTSTISILED